VRYGPLIVFLSLFAGLSRPQSIDPLAQAFLQRVDDYAALHRRMEASLPPDVVTSDVEAIFARRKALAMAIRAARRDARQGDILSPPTARHFRELVAEALKKGAIRNMLAIVEEENTVHVPARVNADYPAGRSIAMMPPSLLAALPRLPPELRYGFVGRDLILWDPHAGLIVDFVANAIPETT
jgi:hypothetical protein